MGDGPLPESLVTSRCHAPTDGMTAPRVRNGPIVVGVDFTPASEPALAEAIRKARQGGARLALVHALTPLGAPGLDLDHPQYDPPRNESADVVLSNPATPESWVERARAAGVDAELVTRPGSPTTVLMAEAARLGARAIVVGTSGGGLARALNGSVSRRLLDESPIPVYVVPGAGPAAA